MPSRKDLEAYLKGHGNDFRKPEEVQIKYISFSSEEEAKKAHDTIYQEENFDAYANQKKLKINTTGFFSLHNPPPEFSRLQDFVRIAFGLQRNEISKVLSVEEGYYIFKLMTRKPSYIPPLSEIEKEVEGRYLEEESTRLYKQESEAILNRLKKGEDVKNISQQKGLKITETGLFLPGSEIPGLGFSQELSKALFQISEKKPYPDNVFNINKNFVIIQFKERGKLDNNDFELKKEHLKNILLETKRKEYLQSWLESSKVSMLKEGKLKLTRDIKNL
jgi:peptidyl-prolyl cis-trans isomerase D